MELTLDAVFRDGVLVPVQPLALEQGQHVSVVVRDPPRPDRWDLARLRAARCSEDAELAAAGLAEWAAALDALDRE